MNALVRAARALGAAFVLALMLVGPPWLLLTFVGNPWPEGGVSLAAPLGDDAFVGLIAVIAWIAWAQLAVVIVIETIRAVRGIRIPEPGGPLGGQQRLIRSLVTAIVATIVVSGTAGAQAVDDHRPSVTTTQDASHAADHGHRAGTDLRTVTTRHGDTVWGLALTHLGDGQRWHEIDNLNQGRVMPDGHRWNADRIQPGWNLRLPATGDRAPAANAGTTTVSDRHERQQRNVRVERGDTLSSLAAKHLGDPSRWRDLMQANRGRLQTDGARLTDPDRLQPGWILRLPDAGHDAGETPGHRAGQKLLQPRQKHGHAESVIEPTNGPPHQDESNSGSGPRPDRLTDDAPREHSDSTPHRGSSDTQTRGDDTDVAVDDAAVSDSDDTVLDAPWVLAGLTGAGVLLAGSLLLGLHQRRRARFRNRKPGRGIAEPDPELAPVEMTLAAAGTASAVIVEHLEAVLRRLASAADAAEDSMPALAAVELTAQRITLHLSEPADLNPPWHGTPDRTHWHIDVDVPLEAVGPAPDHSADPYPQLVTIGEGDDGSLWLLNCEELGTVTVCGDTERGRDFARHLITQLAVNPWSASVQIDCVGIAGETDGLNERVNYHEYDMADRAATEVLADAVTMADRSVEHDTDASTGRASGIGDDTWPSHMLVWDADQPRPDDLTSVIDLVESHRGRTATTVVFTGTTDEDDSMDGFEIRVTSDGRVVLEHAGLNLAAVGLTTEEARGCAMLYAQSELDDDAPAPAEESATQGWETYADFTGALRPEHTLPRRDTGEPADAQTSTLLERDDAAYIASAAAVAEDLRSLSPRVPETVRADVEDTDPSLDADVADWFATECDRPKLRLLGPVEAHTHGKALAKRIPYFTEMLAFLALRRSRGVTSDEICDAFNITPETAHNYIKTTRSWLGTNPRTGEEHLPWADKSPAATTRGVNVYQIDDGLLLDVDLFKRLRVRGQARGGEEGLKDLASALDLVSGRPFDQLRPGGWTWLINGERHDHYMTHAIADIAFLVATDALERDDVDRALVATELALLTAPDEEHTRLCMARIRELQGNHDEAARIVRDDVCNRSDDDGAPTELNDRTRSIINQRQWLAS